MLDRGRVVEHGRRDELAASPAGRYARLRRAARLTERPGPADVAVLADGRRPGDATDPADDRPLDGAELAGEATA